MCGVSYLCIDRLSFYVGIQYLDGHFFVGCLSVGPRWAAGPQGLSAAELELKNPQLLFVTSVLFFFVNGVYVSFLETTTI